MNLDFMPMVVLISFVFAGALYAVYAGLLRILYHKRLHELELAMTRYPNYADVRAQIAGLHYRYGYKMEARRWYYDALKIYRYYHYARLKLGLLCLELNHPEEALHHFRTMRRDASDDEAMMRLIESLMKDKDLYEQYMMDEDNQDDEYWRKNLASKRG